MGLRAGLLQRGPVLQPAELQCKNLLKSPILSGGLQLLQPTNPFDEEKGEARSSASTAGSTPTETSIHIASAELHHQHQQHQQQPGMWPHMLLTHRVDSLLNGLGESRLTDPVVSTWIAIAERYCKQNNLIWHQDFPPEHPISELERHLAAVFIRHQSIGPLVLAVIDRDLSGSTDKLPAPVSDIIKLVHQTKWMLIKTRQQLNRSYKEVCAPMLDKCRFLLYEVRPAISMELSGLNRLNILHKPPRFKQLVRRIIAEIQSSTRKMHHACAKPDDILNVTIQSQQIQKNQSNDNLRKIASTEHLSVAPTNQQTITTATTELLPPQKYSAENLLLELNSTVVDDSNMLTEKIDGKQTGKQKSLENDELFINTVIAKMSEKCVRVCEHGRPSSQVMALIVDFVLQDACDVETLRRAMYCQVQRYQIRKQGIEMIVGLLSVMPRLLDAVQYSVLSGYLGLFLDRPKHHAAAAGNILDDLNMITAYQKADLILAHSTIIEWSIAELQKFVNAEQMYGKQKLHGGKDCSNLGTYVFLKKLPRARFLLSVFGVLSKDFGPNEMSLVINSGALGSILGLLRQTGGGGGDGTSATGGANVGGVAGTAAANRQCNELSYVYEDTILRVSTNILCQLIVIKYYLLL